MKKTIILIIMLLLVLLPGVTVCAAEADDTEVLYEQQADLSGVSSLYSSLPDETKNLLSDMGISSADYKALSETGVHDIFEKILSLAGTKGKTPFGAAAVCLGIMLLCAVVDGTNITMGDRSLSGVSSAVGALCVCTAAVLPMCEVIKRSTVIIQGASGFLMLYVPIMAGLMVSSGHEAAAGSYYTMLMGAGEVITQISARFIAPFMNVFLALSVTSSLSQRLNLSVVCSSVYKCAKWVLTLGMSIFVTILSAQTFITSSLDNVSKRALRFAVSSFVPVVGGVLSETVTAFSGSLELLKSGAGVFVIIASACIFLPVLIECILWQFTLFFLSGAADIMGLGRMKSVFATISTVASMLTAILLCILTIFIISTVVILIIAK